MSPADFFSSSSVTTTLDVTSREGECSPLFEKALANRSHCDGRPPCRCRNRLTSSPHSRFQGPGDQPRNPPLTRALHTRRRNPTPLAKIFRMSKISTRIMSTSAIKSRNYCAALPSSSFLSSAHSFIHASRPTHPPATRCSMRPGSCSRRSSHPARESRPRNRVRQPGGSRASWDRPRREQPPQR
jgi:hypothetical protein